ncbi:MAG: hypothetical protein AAF988_08685 [Pseudomonadota bacterium]
MADTTSQASILNGSTKIPGAEIVEKTRRALDKTKKYWGLYQAYKETLKTPFVVQPFKPPKRATLPDHFSLSEVSFGGKKTRLIGLEASTSTATFILPIGHGTDAVHYTNTAEHLHDSGINVVIMELPVPEENTHFQDGSEITEGYDQAISNIILSGDSPALEGIPHYHSVFLMPHSSSGQSFERVTFNSPEKAAFARRNFDFVYLSAAMLDTANSSVRYNPRLSSLYLKYSAHPNVSPQIAGSTIVDREWLSGNLGVDDCFFDDISTNATHGQANFLKRAGIEHYQAVEAAIASGVDLSDFLSIGRAFLHGKDDESACPLTARDYASMIGADFYKFCTVAHNLPQHIRVDEAILKHAFAVARSEEPIGIKIDQAAASSPAVPKAAHAF